MRPTPTPTPTPTAPTASTFTDLYQRVGVELDRQGKQNDSAAVTGLTRRYRAIAYLDAVRTPSLRSAAIRELEAISRELKKLP